MSDCWYAYYPGDYLRDTAHLTMQEDGAYHRLLGHYYSTGHPLPASKDALYRIARAFTESERASVDSVLLGFFHLKEDGYHNKRADIELARRTEQHERLSNSGRRGAEKRWKDSQAISQAIGQVVASPQPQPQPKEEKRKPAAKPAQPSDSRFQPFYSYAYESYRTKHGRPPIWTGKDRNGLKTLLRGSAADSLPLERLTGLWDNFALSTEPFTAKQSDSLAYFCSNLDKFSSGPILEGGSNGKLVSFAEKRSQKNADAIQSVLGRAEEASGDIRRALPPAHN